MTAPTGIPNSKQPQRWLPRLFQRSNSRGTNIAAAHPSEREGDAEFFASLESNTSLAFFRREEIQVRDVLIKGTFTNTYAVVGIRVADDEDDSSKRLAIQESLFLSSQPRYAIKQLSAETLSNSKTLVRAARELVNDAKYLMRLSHHENIVTLRGLTFDSFGRNYLANQFEDFFLLTDRVRDQTLHDKIYKEWKKETDPNEDCIPMKANYAFQIAKALRFCHQQGVLYRDLKPLNVGFSLQDPHCIQLLDFSLARDLPKDNSSTDVPYRMTVAGTRRYLAGEVLTRGEYTLKSDVYCWAMVYYEMCTERKPYHGLNTGDHQTYVCAKGGRPVLDEFYLPEALDFILTHSWHHQLEKRWGMDQVCTAMQEFLMKLDVNVPYYQQEEGEFLFDIEPAAVQVESWTEEWGGVQGDVDVYQSSIIDRIPAVADPTESEGETEMKMSETNSRRASLSSVQPMTPLKVISEAA